MLFARADEIIEKRRYLLRRELSLMAPRYLLRRKANPVANGEKRTLGGGYRCLPRQRLTHREHRPASMLQ